MPIHPLDPFYQKDSELQRKLINFSIQDDNGTEIGCTVVYFFDEDFSNKYVREVSYKVWGEYTSPEEEILGQVQEEITKRSFKPVIFT